MFAWNYLPAWNRSGNELFCQLSLPEIGTFAFFLIGDSFIVLPTLIVFDYVAIVCWLFRQHLLIL